MLFSSLVYHYHIQSYSKRLLFCLTHLLSVSIFLVTCTQQCVIYSIRFILLYKFLFYTYFGGVVVAWGALLDQEGDEGRVSMEILKEELGGCGLLTFIHFYLYSLTFALSTC